MTKVLSKLSQQLGVAAVCLSSLAVSARADVKLYPLFTDDMILQREKPVPVWGTARAGEKVTVSIAKQSATTVADAAGEWRVSLKAMPAAQDLTLTARGDNEVVLKNVAVGDVYICSGQSNMEWPVAASNNAQAEAAAANYPNIRLFTVPKKVAGTPQKQFNGNVKWQPCSPQSVPGFSAVGYYFGRELHERLKVPIGLINSSWGGTVAQAWTSRSTLLNRDDFRQDTLATEKAFVDTSPFAERMAAWWQANDPGTKNNWSADAFADADWKTIKVPGIWEDNGLANIDGLVWFRKTVEIPAAWEGKELTLSLGPIDDRDTTYFNGVAVGGLDAWNQPRVYKIPSNLVKAGRATIAVRVLDTGGGGGFAGNESRNLQLAGDATQKIDLAGDWKYSVAAGLKNLPPAPTEVSGNPNQPTVLYNGMIAPLVPFAARGAIWYQGESNAGNPGQYRTLFPDMIRDWRTQWGAKQDGSEFGFYFVQLANWLPRVEDPIQSGWAELREAQTMALKVPRTGMALAIDIGDTADIHPRNKQDVGKRLALAALAKEYNQQVDFSGPMFHMMELEAGKPEVKIHFTYARGLKTTDGQSPRAFAIQDQDGKWYKASARIVGETVVLSNEAVAAPKAVRYAWANNPDVNLVNGAGLPAVPFRTDGP